MASRNSWRIACSFNRSGSAAGLGVGFFEDTMSLLLPQARLVFSSSFTHRELSEFCWSSSGEAKSGFQANFFSRNRTCLFLERANTEGDMFFFQRAQQTNSHEDIEKYKNLQKETQFYCRKDVVSGDDRNPKKLWSFIKAKKCYNSGISPLRRDGVAHSNPQVKANILNNQFAGAFTEEDTSSLPSLGPSPFPDVPAFKIGRAGVKKLLRGLKPHKASGPDNIPTRFLKEAANELVPALCPILTASLNQGYVPDDWKTADVTPIFKKGDHSTPANYRPISLTASVARWCSILFTAK